jgi:hypothetical protein
MAIGHWPGTVPESVRTPASIALSLASLSMPLHIDDPVDAQSSATLEATTVVTMV